MDGLAAHVMGIARTVDVLVVLGGDDGEHRGERHLEVFEDLAARVRVLTDELELIGGQGAGLREHGRGNGELADIVQEPAERDDLQLALGVAAEVAQHGRKHRDVDRMGKGVGIVQTDVGELHEVFLLRHDVADEEIGALLQELHVEMTVDFRLAEGLRHVFHGLHARMLIDDVGRRLQLEIGRERGDMKLRHIEVAKLVDIAVRQRRAAHEKGSTLLVEDALSCHHAGFELI